MLDSWVLQCFRMLTSVLSIWRPFQNSNIWMCQTWNSCTTFILRSVSGRGLYSALFLRDMALHSDLVHHQGLFKTVKSFLCRYLCKVTCDLTIRSYPVFWVAGGYSELPYYLFICPSIHLCQHVKCITKEGSFLF